jgi:tRNA (mo5U34)-methyltransferase
VDVELTLEEVTKECPEWFHSIPLSKDVVTPGRKSLDVLRREQSLLALPDLRGKSVLDIGAYDGFFSFATEKLGASRVVALDHYVWSVDMAGYMNDWRESKRTGATLPSPADSRHFRPAELPGRKPFDLARRALDSKVEPVVGDFMTMDLAPLGRFDVVLFLGVLYHLEDPLTAVRRLRSVVAPGGLVVIETEAMEVLGMSRWCYWEFYPGQELNNDPSNWWVPNARALEGMCRAAGFRQTTVSNVPSLVANVGSSLRALVTGGRLPSTHYRAYAHARP